MISELRKNDSKITVFESVKAFLVKEGFQILNEDLTRPWGGFLVLDEGQIRKFKNMFFAEKDLTEEQLSQKLSPKILIVGPEMRLSWQYHHRRAELWKLIAGKSAISRSQTDEQGPVQQMDLGRIVELAQGERHRLIGTDTWGIVAEIWMHVDPSNPSNEDDIVRLQDDFARK